ncbi:unnamed protein product [Fraxinus pennsylvanica]|uniref:Uncharacterized protein n=1 Tax=Fraxinus pennsylvanica TaxID=56036 RepID=A0AAD2E9D6_9LAMI|nr:unnamed protein product [Fraxinus pennsylvanica]
MLEPQFRGWKENTQIILGYVDLDLTLRTEQPAVLMDKSFANEKEDFDQWDRSNRMSLMIIKCGIPETFKGAVFDKVTTVKEFLAEIERRFAKSDKAETNKLLANLVSLRYKGR